MTQSPDDAQSSQAQENPKILEYESDLDDLLPSSSRMATVALIPSMVAFNIVLAQLILVLKLPVFLDCVGIIATTMIAGLIPGLIVTVLAFSITAVLFNSIIIYYTGTAALMAIGTHFLGKMGGFRTLFRTVVCGLVLGIVSALASWPVTYLINGGVTTAGSTVVTYYFMNRGFSVKMAVFFQGLICDALSDKIAEVLLAVWLVRAVPRELLLRFRGASLHKNFFVDVPYFDRPSVVAAGTLVGILVGYPISFFFQPNVQRGFHPFWYYIRGASDVFQDWAQARVAVEVWIITTAICSLIGLVVSFFVIQRQTSGSLRSIDMTFVVEFPGPIVSDPCRKSPPWPAWPR